MQVESVYDYLRMGFRGDFRLHAEEADYLKDPPKWGFVGSVWLTGEAMTGCARIQRGRNLKVQ